jgi:hypothetical protein
MLVFGLQEEETLTWDEFKFCYDSVYPEGQVWLPCGGANAPATTGDTWPVPSGASQASCDDAESAPPGKKAPTPHDPRRECFVLQQQPDAVHSTNSDDSSTEGEPTLPDASASKEPPQDEYNREWQQTHLDELDEAQKALEDEQARLHHMLGMESAATPAHERAQEVRR